MRAAVDQNGKARSAGGKRPHLQQISDTVRASPRGWTTQIRVTAAALQQRWRKAEASGMGSARNGAFPGHFFAYPQRLASFAS